MPGSEARRLGPPGRRRQATAPRQQGRAAGCAAQGAGRGAQTPARDGGCAAGRWARGLFVVRRGAVLRTAARPGPGRPARAGPALRGAGIPAGVRPSDARYRIAARGYGSRAPGAAARSDPGAARRAAELLHAQRLTRSALFARRGITFRRRLHGGSETHAGIHRRGRCLPAGVVGAVLGPAFHRPFRGLSRAAPHQPLSLYVLLPAGRPHGGGFVARSAGEGECQRRSAAASHRGHATALR